MKILVAEDDADLRTTLAGLVRRWGYEVTEARDGADAWDLFRNDAYHVVITDWRMPRLDGLDLCRMLRDLARDSYTYIIVLTAVSGTDRLLEALDAGADDFLTKPFDRAVLRARLRVAERILQLHAHVANLEGILSICAFCKQIRNDDGTWVQVERYVQDRSALKFSHGVCPPCVEKHYSKVLESRQA